MCVRFKVICRPVEVPHWNNWWPCIFNLKKMVTPNGQRIKVTGGHVDNFLVPYSHNQLPFPDSENNTFMIRIIDIHVQEVL